MTRYLHTMYRITDPEKSRTFYEALGLEFRRDLPIVRNGELEALELAVTALDSIEVATRDGYAALRLEFGRQVRVRPPPRESPLG